MTKRDAKLKYEKLLVNKVYIPRYQNVRNKSHNK